MSPEAEMRRPATANGRPDRNVIIRNADIATDLADRQARRLARLYAVSYDTAATIARLAYTVAR